jgi:hypothetical protein
MIADQATLILASMVGAPRRFRSFDLGAAARRRLMVIEKLVEEFDRALWLADYRLALAKMNEAYRVLDAKAPEATTDDVMERRHPLWVAIARKDQAAETAAWQAFMIEMLDK